MRGGDWSLVIFTLLTQLAVGLYLVAEVVNIFCISRWYDYAVEEIAAKISLSIILLLLLAIIVSFIHIGRPKNAAFAVSHFSKSWLSREIAFLMIFAVLAAVSFFLRHVLGGSYLWLSVIAGFIGIIAIFSMAKVYMLETVPAWNSISTLIQFTTASLVLGGLAAIFLLLVFGLELDLGGPPSEVHGKLLAVLLALTAANFIFFLIHILTLRSTGIAGAKSYKLLTENHALLFYIRLVLILISIILFSVLLFMDTKSDSTYVFFILCPVVFVSEIIGRYLFFASYSRVGV